MTTLAKIDANRANARKSTGPRSEAGKAVVALNAVCHGVFAAVPVTPGEDADEWDAHRAGVVASLAPVGLLELTLAERAAGLLWRLRRLAVYEADAVRAAVEDIRLPRPDGGSPTKLVRAINEAKQKITVSRRFLTSAGPAAEWMAGFDARPGDEPVPYTVARRVLQTAIEEVVIGRNLDGDPPLVGSAGFLRRLGRPEDDFIAIPWTVELVRAGFDMYAKYVKRTGDWLSGRVRPALAKAIRRHERTVKTQTARAKGLRVRRQRLTDWQTAGAFLPADGRDERVIRHEGHLSKCLHITLHELERMQASRAGRPVVPPVAVDVTVDGPPDTGGFVSQFLLRSEIGGECP